MVDPEPLAQSSGPTLLRRFTVVSLATTILVGALFGAIAVRVVEDYTLRRQAHTASMYVSEFLAPRLLPQDFLASPTMSRVQFEFALRNLIGKAGIVRVTVWNRRGQVLYSDDPALGGKVFPLSPALRLALSGSLQWQFVHSAAGTGDIPRMEIFVPVVVSGAAHPVAAYHVISDLQDLEPTLMRLKWSVWAGVVLGILTLYVALFTIVRKASRDLEHQHAALQRAFTGIVQSLAHAVDARDMATAHHSTRVAEYAEAIARTMGLTEAVVNEVRVAAFLHDVGKIGIPDEILTKAGPLTEEEWATMRGHAVLGGEILDPVPIADAIKLAVRHSHERWDGRGYPDGLAGGQIPLAARVVAVADAFESLTTDRPYRRAHGPEDAVREIQRCSATQFDPRVVEAFAQVLAQRGVGTSPSGRVLPMRASGAERHDNSGVEKGSRRPVTATKKKGQGLGVG